MTTTKTTTPAAMASILPPARGVAAAAAETDNGRETSATGTASRFVTGAGTASSMGADAGAGIDAAAGTDPAATGTGDDAAMGDVTGVGIEATGANDLPQLLQKLPPGRYGAPQCGQATVDGADAGIGAGATADGDDNGIVAGVRPAATFGAVAPQPAQKRAPSRLARWHCAHSQPAAAVGVAARPPPQPRQNLLRSACTCPQVGQFMKHSPQKEFEAASVSTVPSSRASVDVVSIAMTQDSVE